MYPSYSVKCNSHYFNVSSIPRAVAYQSRQAVIWNPLSVFIHVDKCDG